MALSKQVAHAYPSDLANGARISEVLEITERAYGMFVGQ